MCSKPLVVVCLVAALTAANPLPSETTTTTARSPQQQQMSANDPIKQVANQLMEINATSTDIFTLDTRTPPKIKQKKKNKPSEQQSMENSHAGVAIPIDADEIMLEETTKKLNFYKVEKPTTNSGLSTWILLSGQQVSSTLKPSTRKPVVKPTENINTTLVVEPNKIIKPIFKKRVTSTTPKPTTTTIRTTSVPISTTTVKETSTKLTKVKASIIANANKKSTTFAPHSSTKKSVTTTSKPLSSTTIKIKTTTQPNNISTSTISITNSSSISIQLPAEAKDVETELDENKKTRRPTTSSKRKKNKNRRRRPAEKSDNSTSTKIDKHNKSKEKPIGTQLYNYLSREVMPTVGVGLVGLVVTAGLASYFLYPFGVARRSYEVDRRDKEGTYYYNNDYSGGIAEEEAIGKVIAGMPSNSLYGNAYKTTRHRNRQVDHRIAPTYDYQPVTYDNNPDVIEQSKEAAYTVDDHQQQFVVGNTPKEEVTPAAVPEHGPRSLRWRRQVVDDKENEIDGVSTTTVTTTTTTTESVDSEPTDNQFNSYMKMFQELFKLKISLGLQLIQNATQAVSKYVSRVQERFNEHYRNETLQQN